MTVDVINNSEFDIHNSMVELSLDSVRERFSNIESFIVLDSNGQEIPSQLTFDSLLIFQVTVKAKERLSINILPCDSMRNYKPHVFGKIYAERADDVSWENEIVGFRAYGPATQSKGEQVYGYDLFFKYLDKGLILEKLYEPEINPSTWVKVDSLRAIAPHLADSFVESFSYHVDHGIGMDCFPVGPTLGAGVAAPIAGDSIVFPWCYQNAEILDNGPLRFTVKLSFEPKTIGSNQNISEHRLISLDAGSRFNKTNVWYENQTDSMVIGSGFPIRDAMSCFCDNNTYNMIAYSHPVQREEYGRALLGVYVPVCDGDISFKHGHLLVTRNLAPGQIHEYYWGFKWDKNADLEMGSWIADIKSELINNKPLEIIIK